MRKEAALELPDQNQSVWDLVSIQMAGWTSLPILATSIFILQKNSFLGAIYTIIVGNAILWFLRLAILAMSFTRRESTLDISKDYMGKSGGYFIAVVLLFSTLAWFIAQTTIASNALSGLISLREDPRIDQFSQISILVGITSAFLCMEGIVLLRWLCTIAFPIILVTFFTSLFFLPPMNYQTSSPTSLYGLTLVLATNLGITSDMPTFFRHGASWKTSVKALTMIQIMCLVLGICGVFFSTIFTQDFLLDTQIVLKSNAILKYALVIFIFSSVVCANVANVYSASVGWEIVAPKALVGRKEYLILGLGLTTIFILVANLFSVEILLNVTDSALINLSMILILGYLIQRISNKNTNLFDQWVYFIGWLIATTLNFFQYLDLLNLLIAPFVTALVVMLVVLLSRLHKLFS